MRHYFQNNDLNNLERYFKRETTDATPSHYTGSSVRSRQYVSPKNSIEPEQKGVSKLIPSEEQQSIVNSVRDGNNVIVDSVFGSGKTTTILQICQAMRSTPTLVLTYNARLKIETRDKARKMGLTQVETHSYHALTVRYYSDRGNTDIEIKRVVETGAPIRNTNRRLGLIILDEQQDMTPLYHHLVKKFIRDNQLKNVQIVVLGDTYQNIYGYKGADARFLRLADALFSSVTSRPWERRQISVSYRATHSVSNFINKYLLGYNRVKTVRRGEPVRYLICDAFSSVPFQEVMAYLNELSYSPEDIYILAPSLRAGREKSPIRRLENRLVEAGIPCFVPVDDNEELGDNVTRGKLVFSTFHQIKGSERPVTLVYNIDESYFNYYARDVSRVECPNPVYVALSRSLKHLSVIHHYENNYFPMMDKTKLVTDRLVDFQELKPLAIKNKFNANKELDCSVTDLIRHLDMETIVELSEKYTTKVIKRAGKSLNVALTVETDNGHAENVSELNGIAIPMSFELKQCGGHCSVLEHLMKNSETLPIEHRNHISDVRKRLKSREGGGLAISDKLYLANLYNAYVSGYNSKREQIKNYDWLSQDTLDIAETRLAQYISESAEYEKELKWVMLGRKITGHLDIVNQGIIWELKCVKQLEPAHFIQIAVYAWLYQQNCNRVPELQVFNILTDEVVGLTFHDPDGLEELVSTLVKKKYGTKREIQSDEEFLADLTKSNKNPQISTSGGSKKKCLIFQDSDSDSD